MKSALFLSLIFLFISCSSLNKQQIKKNNDSFNWDRNFIPIMQAATNETNTIINFIVPKSFKYKVSAKGKHSKENLKFKEKIITNKKAYWNLIELSFSNLNIEDTYELNITISRKSYSYSDVREFRSLDTKKVKHHISISSCMSDAYSDIGDVAWASINKQDVDAFFFIGDVVYADYHNGRYTGQPVRSSQEIWSRHIDARNTLAIYRLKKLKPIFATWDDHDLGKNDSDKHFSFLKQSHKYFRSFFPINKQVSTNQGPGSSFKFKLGNHEFYFLDNRSFRDSNELKNGYHLGKRQTNWLLKDIKQGNSTNWLIQGDQFFGGYHPFESFEGKHPIKFDLFLDKLKNIGKKYAFISGDRHMYEFMNIEKSKVGHETVEITTSGIHAKTFAGAANSFSNPRRKLAIDSQYTSILLTLDGDLASFKVLDHKGSVLDKRKINLKGNRP